MATYVPASCRCFLARLSFGICLLLAMPSGFCLAGDGPSPLDSGALCAEISRLLETEGIPGAGIALLSRKETIWQGGAGRADVAARRPVTAETLFRAGSISKTVIALAFLRLQEEGRIDLQAKVSVVLPDFPLENPYEDTHPLRVIHVLEHTAGFDDSHPDEMFVPASLAVEPLSRWLGSRPDSLRVRWKPGSRASYSNPGYALAGCIIEKVTGRPFEEYIRQAVFQPLGMTAATFTVSPGDERLAKAYLDRNLTPAPFRHARLRPAANLAATAAGLGRLVRMLLNRGRIDGTEFLPESAIQQMETVHTTLAARCGLTQGYGPGNDVDQQFPLTLRGHDGGLPGFASLFRYSPEAGAGYVLLFNTTGAAAGRQQIHRLIYSRLMASLAGPPPPPAPAPDRLPDWPAEWPGTYRLANPKDQRFSLRDSLLSPVEVIRRGDRLYLEGYGQPARELIPAGTNLLRHPEEASASAGFTRDEAGELVLFTGNGWNYYEKTSRWRVWLHRLFVLFCLALALSVLPVTIFRLAGRMCGFFKNRRQPVIRMFSFLAAVFLLAWIWLFMTTPYFRLGEVGLRTAGMWLAGLSFAGCALAGLILLLRSGTWPRRGVFYWYSLLESGAAIALSLYLTINGLTGLPSWLW